MQAVLLTFKYFQRADKNKLQQCNNNFHSLKFSMVDSSLILDFALQEVVRSCQGLKRRCTHCCMGIGEGVTHEGSGRERAGCRRDLDVGGGKACAGSGRRLSAAAGQHHAGQRELSRLRARAPAPAADVPRAGRGPAPARQQHLAGLQTPSRPALKINPL